MRVGYSATIADFCNDETVLGCLTKTSANYYVLRDQTQSWIKEIEMLKTILPGFELAGRIYFEYEIPRMAKRADVVLLIDGVMFVLEYKNELKSKKSEEDELQKGYFSLADCDQVSDYAHEFSYFYSTSHFCPIVPILIDTGAKDLKEEDPLEIDDYNVYKVLRCNSGEKLAAILKKALAVIPKENRLQDYEAWEKGIYEPTPTIVEVAETVYAEHTVDEISRSGVGAEGITNATNAINAIIKDACENKKKVICFLTGVPGAGKTLVGIKLVSSREDMEANRVFLSGNYPLVTVLQAALVEDRIKSVSLIKDKLAANEALTLHQKGIIAGSNIKVAEKPDKKGNYKVTGNITKKEIARQVKTKIQLVPNFRTGFDESPFPPNEHVFVFDEAQRAWSSEKVKKEEKRTDGMSEPDILLSYLDRHQDWCVAIALVGTGQDIHDGEAGISEWYKALTNKFAGWEINVAKTENTEEFKQMYEVHKTSLKTNPSLYLKQPMRSFRAQQISDFVEALLLGKDGVDNAKILLQELSSEGEDGRVRFPVYITRNLALAKEKIISMAKGKERYGVLISSRAKRLRHYGMFAPAQDFDQVAWFLDEKTSINSSYSMEVAASEFKIQGLEIDYTLVGWDADFKYNKIKGKFECQNFSVSEGCWNCLSGETAETKCRYLTNAYRVILTRARQGMVIFIPTGDKRDKTVLPEAYDETYEFLKSIGIPEI